MAYNDGLFQLLDDASATGSAVAWPGGLGSFSLPAGTIGGATVKLQWQPDGTNWVDVDRSPDTYVTFTSTGLSGLFQLPPANIRAAVSGGTPSALNAYAQTIAG